MAPTSFKSAVWMLAGLAALAAPACRKQGMVDQDQLGAAVGEVMADVDESTSGSGATAQLLPILRTPDELRAPAWERIFDTVVPPVYAAGCAQATFSGCSS